MRLTKGRVPSLLAWGLLVGGIALLMTYPENASRPAAAPGLLPAAFLFLLGGGVFGLSHPEPGDWAGAALLGWVPLLAGAVLVLAGGELAAWLPLMLLPAVLSAVGAWIGALVARRRA